MVINPIVGVYIPIIRIPIKGGMTIPNIATFDHGTDAAISKSDTKSQTLFQIMAYHAVSPDFGGYCFKELIETTTYG